MAKIYIDGLFYKGSGIGRYYEFLLGELSKHITTYTCVPQRLEEEFINQFGDNSNINPMFVDYEKFSIKGFINQSAVLKNLEPKVNLFFFPHINLPFYVPQNTVVTIHDLRPFTEFWDRNTIKKIILKRIFYDRAIKRSKAIIAISKTTKEDILKNFPKLQKKINIIYQAFSINTQRTTEVEKRLVEKDYILYVGQFKKHKNIDRLIKSFSFIKNKANIKLVLAGKEDNIDILNIVRNKKMEKDIQVFMNPSDEELINLYKNAKTLILPSLYEGFGLPPLEALYFDIPILLSNIPIFKEIYEDIAIYFDPYSEKDIAQKILYTLENYKTIKVQVKTKKEYIFNKFKKDKIIEKYLIFFDEISRELL